MAKFEIDEIAIFDPSLKPEICVRGISGNGSECQIKSERFFRQSRHTGAGYFYMCEFPGDPCPDDVNGCWAVREVSLRKKQPSQELSSWEAIEELTGWSPLKENTNEPIN